LHEHSNLSKKGFGAVLTSAPHLPGLGVPETLKAEEHIFENCLRKNVQQVAN